MKLFCLLFGGLLSIGAYAQTVTIDGATITGTNFSITGASISGACTGCGTVTGGSGISGLTTNALPKATSSTTIGDSCVTDDGTIATVGCSGGLVVGNPSAHKVTLQAPSDLSLDYTLNLPAKNGTLATLDDVSGGGSSSTISDVSAARTPGSIYQNTTGKLKFVSVLGHASSSNTEQCIIDSVNPPGAANYACLVSLGANINGTCTFMVPDMWYYKCFFSAGTQTILKWWETQ